MNRAERRALQAKVDKFIAERNRAFEADDLEWARKHMPFKPSSDVVPEIAFHKARAGCAQVSPAKRQASYAWLTERGYSMLPGQEAPPLN